MPVSLQSARRRAGDRSVAPLCAALTLLGACDLPTSIPQVDQRWITSAERTVVPLGDLLPAGIRIAPDSSAFLVDVAPVTITRALSADCGACVAANGTTGPKPAFVVIAGASTPLPADVAGATLTAGTLQLTVQNNYNFDPLRPSATARGYAVITVANGAQVIGRDSVNGATTALPAGGALTRSIALSGPIASGPVTITVRLDSPAGDAVQIDASRTLVATATPQNLRVASAAITIFDRQVNATSHADLTDVDQTIVTHVTGGALALEIDNPFAVAGTITVRLSAPGINTITRTFALVPGISAPSIALSQDEIRSLLGHDVTATFTGPVTGTSGAVTVTPKQAVVVRSRLDLTIHTGG